MKTLGRSQLSPLLLLPLLLAGAAFLAIESSVGAQSLNYFYYTPKGRAEIRIADDRFGILVHTAPTPRELRRILGTLEVRLLRTYPGGLLVVSKTRSRGVDVQMDLARRAAQLPRTPIVRAGLLVSTATTKVPLLLSDDFIAQFQPRASAADIDAFNARRGVSVVLQNPFGKNQFLLRPLRSSGLSGANMANRYHEDPLVQFAHPNFMRPVTFRETMPDDPYFPSQWHLHNTGQSAGTPDADVDAPKAWDLTQGASGTIVAVNDDGFETGHPDLAANLWRNPGEIAGNALDDDGNGLVDDVHGWNFKGCDCANPAPGCGRGDLSGAHPGCSGGPPASGHSDHGTAVAGAISSTGNNGQGVTGICPNCRLLLLSVPVSNFAGAGMASDFAMSMAFDYARSMGVKVVNNSWGTSLDPLPAATVVAISNAANAGIAVIFSMTSTDPSGDEDNCDLALSDISALESVIAVSASSNRDRRTPAGYGNCMDLLSPTDGHNTPEAFTALWATTTDRSGASGYNDASGNLNCPTDELSTPASALDYTSCFWGTSFSAAVTSGIAGLVASASPGVSSVQLQRVLQDTADKIEPSAAQYDPVTGFSQAVDPNDPTLVTATHGWGRVNAFEAVRTVAPTASGGRGGIDIFLRDNALDWGNTEQPSNVLMGPTRGFVEHWKSADIKVDAPPYQTQPTTSEAFDALAHENPASGQLNRVYVRARNRGIGPASGVAVKLLWAFAGTALPALPSDFWAVFPADSPDTSQWHPLGAQNIGTLPYSGPSGAGCPGRAYPSCVESVDPLSVTVLTDAAAVLRFDWMGPTVDPNVQQPRHFCLLAMLHSAEDPVSSASMGSLVVDWITPRDNNVTHRNVQVQSTGTGPASVGTTSAFTFYVRNPTGEPIQAMLEVGTPHRWRVELDRFGFNVPFRLSRRQSVLVSLKITRPLPSSVGDVEVRQRSLRSRLPFTGGISFEFR